MVNLSQNPVKRPCKPIIQYKPAWDPIIRLCSYTPRFSYKVLKTVICACSWSPYTVPSRACGTGYGTGWVYGVGIRGGYRGVLPSRRARKPHTQRSGPRKPKGLEWVGYGAGRVSLSVRRRGRLLYHPAGPVRLPGALPVQDP